jgi:site-specific DNA-methyltransferase (adenine-specific)
MVERNSMLQGNCLELMSGIEDKSIDMILCDLPYGTTACKWDTILPFVSLWEQYERVIKDNGAIVLFCQQPFTAALVSSNYALFKYMWYWRKSRPSGFVNARLKPLKDIEEIAVFSKGSTANGAKNNMIYVPQGLVEVNKKWKRPKRYGDGKGVNTMRENHSLDRVIEYENYPRQVLDYEMHNVGQIHPTQKPVALFEYLIKTYTKEGEVVLDNTAGSMTTAIASINTDRDFIVIEKDPEYFRKGSERVNNHIEDLIAKAG